MPVTRSAALQSDRDLPSQDSDDSKRQIPDPDRLADWSRVGKKAISDSLADDGDASRCAE
jgi:hypothetical protein